MKKAAKVLAVYFSFMCILFGIAVSLPAFANAIATPLWAIILVCAITDIGLTFFWFQFRPLSK